MEPQPTEQPADTQFDAVVIGTGFGGAVAACRLAEAKQKVCVLERGRRYNPGDFPRPAWRPDSLPDTARWAWGIDHGLWDVKNLDGVIAVQAAGYGGGSLVYANVHLRPPREVFSRQNGWPATYEERKELDRYFDVVAAALRVTPFPSDPPPIAKLDGPLPKLRAMREAAASLHRDGWFFKPPLAIDFNKCEMKGECVAGCPVQAKNTLDLTYLAAAEQFPNVEVRTLAEVIEIEDRNEAYTVHYRDHATGEKDVAISASSVFLCAGALNSTHILLRSANRLGLDRGAIGQGFFANGDAIAMVYDTSPAPKPTFGPTITSALLYSDAPNPWMHCVRENSRARARGDWFMIQDGGYPKWLEQVLGAFRGAYWLQRNRIERASHPHRSSVPSEELRTHVRRFGRALKGYCEAQCAIQNREQPTGSLLPDQIEELLAVLKKEISSREWNEVKLIGGEIIQETRLRWLEDKPRMLRCLLEWIVSKAERDISDIAPKATVDILNRHFLHAQPRDNDPYSLQTLQKLGERVAHELFVGTPPGDHTFVMLAMGLDRAPGQLSVAPDDRLVASWDLAANAPFSGKEEQLMSDVARAMGGELRLNPDTTAEQRPITVHCLGGCPMGRVTDEDGKVLGTRALWVLDGAAIPGPLGANPSATIAALAERNVRKALQHRNVDLPLPGPDEPPLPGGERTIHEIQLALGQTEEVLAPFDKMDRNAPAPAAQPVGIEFKEVMRGFYGAGDGKRMRAELNASIPDLNAFLADPFRRVEVCGSVWLSSGPRTPEVRYAAKGRLDLLKRVESKTALQNLFQRAGALMSAFQAQSLDSTEPSQVAVLLRQLDRETRRYQMEYDLTLSDEAGTPSHHFAGLKQIVGSPSATAPWTETTTLSFTLTPSAGGQAECGTLRVHMADLLGRQIPSFQVTGTTDHVRIAWAFGRFFQFFFGVLRRVYLPHLHLPDPLSQRTP